MEDNEEKLEYILCAANYYNDGIEYAHSPTNIKTGFVVCGHRHHNCIQTFAQIVEFPYDNKALKLQRTEVQGFLTNKNRFVDREDAARIAFISGQIKDPNLEKLYSENLY